MHVFLLRAIIKTYNQIFIMQCLLLQIGKKIRVPDTYISNDYIIVINFMKVKLKHVTGRKQKTQKGKH